MKRFLLVFLLPLFWPALAHAEPPSAQISLVSPSNPNQAVTSTAVENLRYQITFSAPVDGFALEDLNLSSSPGGTWNIGNLQSTDNQTWTAEVWRSAGGGDGLIALRLAPESVSAGGESGPTAEVVSSPLRIDTQSPSGAEFSFDYFDGANNTSWLSGPLGKDWYRGAGWTGSRTWMDSIQIGSAWVALEDSGDIYRSAGSDWSLARAGTEKWKSLEKWNSRLWALDGDGVLLSSANGTTWQSEASLPAGSWIELATEGSYLYALASDGAVYSFDGTSWSLSRGAPGGTWVSLAASPSALLALASDGNVARLFRGSWESSSIPLTATWKKAVWGGGKWWAASSEGNLYSSSEAATWQSVALPSTETVLDLSFAKGRIYLLRDGGLGLASTNLLFSRTDAFSWQEETISEPALGLGPWQKFASGDGEALLLGDNSSLFSAGAFRAAIASAPTRESISVPSDASPWGESIVRSSSALLQNGLCGGSWSEDWSLDSSASWPAEETFAEDTCYRYMRTVSDRAGNTEQQGLVFSYAVPPAVSSFTRTTFGTVLNRNRVQSGITYSLVFSEPLGAGELAIGDFQFRGTSSGTWSGELATSDRKTWTLTVSSLDASSGTFWPELQSESVADEAGNSGPVAAAPAASSTLDTAAPPQPSWVGEAPPAIRNTNTFSLQFAAGEPGGTMICTLDSETPSGTCSSPQMWYSVGEGSHTIRIWQRDDAGNLSDPLVYTFSVDTIAPAAPVFQSDITSGMSTQSRSATASWTSSEPTECSWNGGAWTSCTSPQSWSDLDDGQYSFRVRAKDSADNLSTEEGISWTVDNVAPLAPVIDSGPAPFVASSSAMFSWSGEPLALYECRLIRNGIPDSWEPCASPYSLTLLPSGEYTLDLRQKDRAGNVSPATSWSWEIILSEPPRPTISSGPSELTSAKAAEFQFSSAEVHDFECLVGSDWQPCSSPFRIENLSDGSRTFQVRQRNIAGTAGPAALWSWTVDATPPLAPEVDSYPPEWTPLGAASFAWRGDFNTTSLCSLNGGAWQSCTSIWELEGLSERQHIFRVRSRDEAGNLSEIWEHRWTVDKTAPAPPSWTAGPQGAAPDLQSTFAWSTEEGAESQCSLDDQPWDACVSPLQLRFAVAGEHTLRVRQIDRAGNVSGPASRSWSIDLSNPPVPEIIDSPGAWTNSAWASFSWLGERGNSAQCSLDGGAWEKCSSPYEYSSVAPGAHAFRVRQVRPSGRPGQPASTKWGYDPAAPSLSSISMKFSGKKALVRMRAADTGGSGLATLQLRPGKAYPVSTKKIKLRKLPSQARVCDKAGSCSAWVRVKKK